MFFFRALDLDLYVNVRVWFAWECTTLWLWLCPKLAHFLFAIQITNLVSSIERIQWMPKGNFNWTRNHKMCSLQLTERRYECINSFVSIYCRRTFYMWMRNGVRVNLLNWHFTIGKIYSFFCLSLVILVSFKYYLS